MNSSIKPPPLDDQLKARIREAVDGAGVGGNTRDMVATQAFYDRLRETWRIAWRQRRVSLSSFEPGMQALVRLAREVERERTVSR